MSEGIATQQKPFKFNKPDPLVKIKRAADLAAGKVFIPRQIVGGKQIGRNSKCPCGSGKKFKNCHGSQRSEVRNQKLEKIQSKATSRFVGNQFSITNMQVKGKR